jgi:hypothetical protein
VPNRCLVDRDQNQIEMKQRGQRVLALVSFGAQHWELTLFPVSKLEPSVHACCIKGACGMELPALLLSYPESRPVWITRSLQPVGSTAKTMKKTRQIKFSLLWKGFRRDPGADMVF